MGCDIHFVVERQYYHIWLGIASTDFGYSPMTKSRNYCFFAELASVRGESSKGRKPLGLPESPSLLTRMSFERWGADAHSVSNMSLAEFMQSYIDARDIHGINPVEDAVRKYPDYKLMDIDIDDGFGRGIIDEYRVVFWFDN